MLKNLARFVVDFCKREDGPTAGTHPQGTQVAGTHAGPEAVTGPRNAHHDRLQKTNLAKPDKQVRLGGGPSDLGALQKPIERRY
jgi:hypothetical protein